MQPLMRECIHSRIKLFVFLQKLLAISISPLQQFLLRISHVLFVPHFFFTRLRIFIYSHDLSYSYSKYILAFRLVKDKTPIAEEQC